MSLSPRFMQDLRDRLTLSEVIGRRVKLTRAGREFKGCCPFHREKSPSFYVNDDKQFFHCFGCGAHGDAVGFAMRHDNLSFIEAIESLAAQAGLQVPQQSPQDMEFSRKEKSLYALCEEATKWFEAQLHDTRNRDVLDYIRGRGMSPEMIDAFRLGYASADDQLLRRHLVQCGYTDAQMIEAGIIKPSSKGGDPYAFFRDRLMFPVSDARGRVVAFGGRVLPEYLRPPTRSDFKPPKYINSSDTQLFHKGRMLYAGQHARLAAKGHKIVVVEGYMDVMACHQAGFRGAVAPLGTALTEEQIAVLWKMIPHDIKEPILCFDGDEAGYRAALRASERVIPLLQPNQTVRFAFLPEGDDPDTYIRENGAAAFGEMLDRALPLIDFLWMHHIAGKTFATPESRAGLSAALDAIAEKIPSRDLQYHYRQMFRDKLRNFLGTGWQDKRGSHGKRNGRAPEVIVLPPISRRKADILAPKVLLVTLLNHPQIYPYIVDECARWVTAGNNEQGELGELIRAAINILEKEMDEETLENLDSAALLLQIEGAGTSEYVRAQTKGVLESESIYLHAGFAKPDVTDDMALAGWKSVWNQWDKSMEADMVEARKALIQAMTPENEERILALVQMRKVSDAE